MAAGAKEQPYVVEYYYKAKWGHADEFIALFKKNHYPVLKKETDDKGDVPTRRDSRADRGEERLQKHGPAHLCLGALRRMHRIL